MYFFLVIFMSSGQGVHNGFWVVTGFIMEGSPCFFVAVKW